MTEKPERRLDAFFLPGHAVLIRPVRPGEVPHQLAKPAEDAYETLRALRNKVSRSKREDLERWVRLEHLPRVADRIMEFVQMNVVDGLVLLTDKERQALATKLKEFA